MAELRVKGGGALPPIAARVVVGVCDIAGVGVRALMGLKPSDGSKATATQLELHGVGERGSGEDDASGPGAGAVFTAGGDPDLAEVGVALTPGCQIGYMDPYRLLSSTGAPNHTPYEGGVTPGCHSSGHVDHTGFHPWGVLTAN
jgi:hypothetical protein